MDLTYEQKMMLQKYFGELGFPNSDDSALESSEEKPKPKTNSYTSEYDEEKKQKVEDWYAGDLMRRVNAISGLRSQHEKINKENNQIANRIEPAMGMAEGLIRQKEIEEEMKTLNE